MSEKSAPAFRVTIGGQIAPTYNADATDRAAVEVEAAKLAGPGRTATLWVPTGRVDQGGEAEWQPIAAVKGTR